MITKEEKQQKALLDCYQALNRLDEALVDLEQKASEELSLASGFDTDHPDTFLQLFQQTQNTLVEIRWQARRAKNFLRDYRELERTERQPSLRKSLTSLIPSGRKRETETPREPLSTSPIETLSNRVSRVEGQVSQLQTMLMVVVVIAIIEFFLIVGV
ncbi:MAG: hypothetical protein AB4426_10975 [Xenococcaceae cyanobacterium]